jgi:hypothetical protein
MADVGNQIGEPPPPANFMRVAGFYDFGHSLDQRWDTKMTPAGYSDPGSLQERARSDNLQPFLWPFTIFLSAGERKMVQNGQDNGGDATQRSR